MDDRDDRNEKRVDQLKMSEEDIPIKQLILLQVLLTIIAAGLTAYFYSPDWIELMLKPGGTAFNIAAGLLGAAVLILPAWFYSMFRSEELRKAVKPLLPVVRNPLGLLLLISFLAGLGEELLFRAFLQQMLGLWPAAVLFMLAHAGFWAVPPRTEARLLFAPFSLAAGVVMGLLFREAGLLAAINAHFLYDLAAFYMLKRNYTGYGG